MRKLLILLDKLRDSLATDGIAGTWRKVRHTLDGGNKEPRSAFDLAHGTDTSGIVPLWQTSVDPAQARSGERYQAANDVQARAAIEALDLDPTAYTFVDLGCGKGLPLLIAGQLGFSRIIGVEFAPELAEIARANLARMGFTQAEVVTEGAGEFTFPLSPLVIFFYNSFQPEVLARCLARLRHTAPPQASFIYLNPQHRAFIEQQPDFHSLPVTEGLGEWVRLYRIIPAA